MEMCFKKPPFFVSKLIIKDQGIGWLFKEFKFWNGLSFKKLCGESRAVDISSAKEWKEKNLKLLLSKYSAEDAFNME